MVRAFFSTVVLVFASLLGLHHAKPAAVAPVAIVQSPSVHSLSVPSLSVAAIALTPTPSAPAIAPATIRSTPATADTGLVLGTSTSASDTVTHAELNAALNQLGNSLRSQFFSITSSGPSFSGPAASTPVSFQTFATSQNIDQLSGTKLTNITVSGVSGLTAADIPTNIVAANYLPLTGGTVAGNLTVNVGSLSALGLASNGVVSTSLQRDQRLAISGHYLYGATSNSSQTTIHVIDISNPASPITVSTTIVGIGSQAYQSYTGSLTVAGTNLYLSMQNDQALAFDISNPVNPIYIANIDSWNSYTNDLGIVRGKYFYEAPGYGGGINILDISNPRSPVLVGSNYAVSYSNAVASQALAGNYLYVVDANNALRIYNISDPANPTYVSSVVSVLGNWGAPKLIAVQGRYVYGVSYELGGPQFQIIDVSSPSSPTLVYNGTVHGNAEPRSVYVSGKRAYLGTSDGLQAYDISAPTAPVYLGNLSSTPFTSYSDGLYRDDMAVSGHYMFTSTGEVIDLGGAYIQQLETGGLFTNDLQVTQTALFQNGINVLGGINIGDGGLYSTGAIGVSGSGDANLFSVKVNATSSKTSNFDAALITNTATSSTGSLIKTGLNIQSTGNWTGSTAKNIGLYVSGVSGGTNNYDAIFNGGGNVGVGTANPYSRLQVTGPDTASTSAFAVVNSASTTVFSIYDNGNATYSGSMFQSSDARLKTGVEPLDASSSLVAVEALNPVSYTRLDQPGQGQNLGFLAQAVQAIFPELVSTTSATALTPGGTLTLNYVGLISPIVSAIQALDSEISALASTISGFAQNVATQTLVADNGTFKQVTTDKLCVTKADGTPVCITGDGLDQILTNENVSPASSATPAIAPPAPSGSTASSSSDTATSTATTTADAPSIVPDYNATTTLPTAAPADVATSSVPSPTVEEATSTVQ